jgi:hypothetical protein
MPTDEELVVFNLMNDNWNAQNVAKPPINYKDDTRSASATRGMKVYYVDGVSQARGLGYTSEKVDIRLSIDFWSTSRDEVLKIREEVGRILNLKRKSTGSSFDWMEHGEGRKLASYTGFYRYVVDVVLHQTVRAMP